MFKNPFYVVAAAFWSLVVISGTIEGLVSYGFSDSVIAAATLLQAVGMCISVAAQDPTYGRGYLFGAAFGVAGFWVIASPASSPMVLCGAFLPGGIFLAVMAVTYRYRIRRRIDEHHLPARVEDV